MAGVPATGLPCCAHAVSPGNFCGHRRLAARRRWPLGATWPARGQEGEAPAGEAEVSSWAPPRARTHKWPLWGVGHLGVAALDLELPPRAVIPL